MHQLIEMPYPGMHAEKFLGPAGEILGRFMRADN